MDKLQKYFPLVKVDEAQRIVYGLVTAERRDHDGETCHYDSTKREYQKVNDELGKASSGENIMPLREMHQLKAVGAGKSITFDDDNKQILMAFEVVDDAVWAKVCKKVLLGFSQGGRYIKRWKEGATNFFTAQPYEVSLVDKPCLPGSYIEYSKADGGTEFFRTPHDMSDDDVSRISKSFISELSTHAKEIRALFTHSEDSNAATGGSMKPEEIKKCAAALGITEDEFAKQYVVEGKIAKAAVVEPPPAPPKVDDPPPPAPEVLTKADAEKMVTDAVTKAVADAMAKLPKNDEADKVNLRAVARNGAVTKVDSLYGGIL